MLTEVVLVEREDKHENNLYGSSGIFIDSKYVLITSNILDHILQNESIKTFLSTMRPGVLCTFDSLPSLKLNIVSKKEKSEGLFKFHSADIIAAFSSPAIKKACGILKDFAIDLKQNKHVLSNILSVFFILKVEQKGSIADLKITLKKWFREILREDICKGDEIRMECVPFANRGFIKSYSQGIISNILGESDCLMLTDCHSTPGCEGSPIYSLKQSSKKLPPLGIVVSTLCWWRGEWIGITLVADIRALIMPLLGENISKTISSIQEPNLNYKLLSSVEYSLAQVYCGSSAWGTAILIDRVQGVFLTSSHLLDGGAKIQLHWKGLSEPCECIYKTPERSIIDVAIIRVKCVNNKMCHRMKPVVISENIYKICDVIYSAGYPLFPRESNTGPTLSKGHISKCSQTIIETTSFVYAGSSGGAILDPYGKLMGVIVSNIKLEGFGVFPKSNMAVSVLAIYNIIKEYLGNNDKNVLTKLDKMSNEINESQIRRWSLQAKL